MIACAPPSVVIHNPEFAKWAGSEKGDKAVVDGAKALAMTALDVLSDKKLMQQAKAEFDETAAFSAESLVAAWHGEGGHGNGDAGLGGCGCC